MLVFILKISDDKTNIHENFSTCLSRFVSGIWKIFPIFIDLTSFLCEILFNKYHFQDMKSLSRHSSIDLCYQLLKPKKKKKKQYSERRIA